MNPPGGLPPPRVCYLGLSRWPNGPGDPRVFEKQLPTLAANGYDVTALVTGEGPSYALRGVKIKPCGWAGGLWTRCRHLPDVYRKAARERADCYFFGNFELLPVALLLKLRTRASLAYDSMEHYPDMMRASRHVPHAARGFLATLVDLAERALCSRMDLVLTADTPTMSRFFRMDNAEVIFNYPDIDILDAYDSVLSNALHNRYCGRRVIVYVGSMGWDRGLRQMAYTMKELRYTHPDVLLCLLGGWQFQSVREEFECLVTELDIAESVEIVGHVPYRDIGTYLRSSEIGISLLEESAKHTKNISTKQFDYMAASIPSVVNSLDPFLLYTGRAMAGVVVRTLAPEAIAQACRQLLADSSLRMLMGRNGRRLVEESWNWSIESKKLVRAFLHMMGGAEAANDTRPSAGPPAESSGPEVLDLPRK